MRYPSVGTFTHTRALTVTVNEQKEKNTMRKHILAITVTIALAATVNAAPVRKSDPGMGPRDRDVTPIVRVIRSVKKFFGIGANDNLPAVPLPGGGATDSN